MRPLATLLSKLLGQKRCLSSQREKLRSSAKQSKFKSFNHLNRAETQFTFNAKYPKHFGLGAGRRGGKSKDFKTRNNISVEEKRRKSGVGFGAKSSRSSASRLSSRSTQLAIPAKFKLSKIPIGHSASSRIGPSTFQKSSPTDVSSKAISKSHSATTKKSASTKKNASTKTSASTKTENSPVKEKKISTREKFALIGKDQLNHWYETSHQQNKNMIWPSFGLSMPVMDAIKHGLKFTHPAPVQSIFLSNDLNRNILCGSQTGSGKTAAYLVSIFDHLKKEEMAAASSTSATNGSTSTTDESSSNNGSKSNKGSTSATNGSSSLELSQTKSGSLEADVSSVDSVLDSDIDAALSSLSAKESADKDALLDSQETAAATVPSLRKIKRPRAIILVPSRHLVHQVTGVAKTMSHFCRLRVVGLHSKTKNAKSTYEESPIDLLITTPTNLLLLIEQEGFSLSQTTRIVLDEADTLFDKNFLPETTRIIQMVRRMDSLLLSKKSSLAYNGKSSMTPFHLFTATFPQTLNQTISALFSSADTDGVYTSSSSSTSALIKLTTPSLHRPVKSVHHAFLRLNQSTTKNNLLMETIKRAATADAKGTTSSFSRLLIFCNTQDSAKQVYSFLKTEKKVPGVLLLSSHLPIKELEASLHTFVNKQQPQPDGKQKDEGLVIAVSTDLASRGLDTLHVGHVINYDFPLTVMDYVHRTGRTGRYGRKGRATSFVEKRDWNLASEIEERVKRGHSM